MKDCIPTFLVILLALSSASGQSLSPVIATSGDFFSSPNGSLSWTLGEISTETFQKSAGILTQGFQQPQEATVTGLELNHDLSFYPNPVRTFLFVKTTEAGEYLLELFNLQGQRVINQQSYADASVQLQIDMKEIRNALYLLRITNTSTGKSSIHKIEKF